MKKRLITYLTIASVLVLSMVFGLVGTVFAGSPTLDVSVESSDIEVVNVAPPMLPYGTPMLMGNNYYTNTKLTLTGTIFITSEADPNHSIASSFAGSAAVAYVVQPDGTTTVIDSNSLVDIGWGNYSADANQEFTWECALVLTDTGAWIVTQEGIASAGYWYFLAHFGADSDYDFSSFTANAIQAPPPQAPWYGFQGFTVYINNNPLAYQSSAWASLWQVISRVSPVSHVLATDINLTADGINVFIPAGTEITTANTGNPMLDNLGIQYINGIHGGVLSFFTQNMEFSNPVVITNIATGEVLASFMSIVNGKPSNAQVIAN